MSNAPMRLVDENGNIVPDRYTALGWARTVVTGKGTSTKAVLLAMVLRVDDRLVCWPGWDLIGVDIEASKTTVWRCVKNLQELGLVFHVQTRNRDKQSSNLYVVNVKGWLDDLQKDNVAVMARMAHITEQVDRDLAPRGRKLQNPR